MNFSLFPRRLKFKKFLSFSNSYCKLLCVRYLNFYFYFFQSHCFQLSPQKYKCIIFHRSLSYLWIESICKRRNFFLNKLGDEARLPVRHRWSRMQTLRHGQGASGSLNSLEPSVQGQNSIELCILETLVDAISFFLFFLPLPFFSIFIPTRTSVQNCTRRDGRGGKIPGDGDFEKSKIFRKIFHSKLLYRIKWKIYSLPRNSKNFKF